MIHHFLDGSGAWGWQSLAPLQGEVVRGGINLFSSIALRHAALYARNAMLRHVLSSTAFFEGSVCQDPRRD